MADSSTDRKNIELDALFKRADDVVATSVIGRPKRGSGYIPKVDAKIRLNAEVMAWLKEMGPRHYSRINGLLTALMELDKNTRDQVAGSEEPVGGSQTDSSASAEPESAGESAAPSGTTTESIPEEGGISSTDTREEVQG